MLFGFTSVNNNFNKNFLGFRQKNANQNYKNRTKPNKKDYF